MPVQFLCSVKRIFLLKNALFNFICKWRINFAILSFMHKTNKYPALFFERSIYKDYTWYHKLIILGFFL